MRRIVYLPVIAMAMLMTACHSDKRQALLDELKAGIDSCKMERLEAVFPGLKKMGVDFKDCTVSFNKDSIREEGDKTLIPVTIMCSQNNTKSLITVWFTAITGKGDDLQITESNGLMLLSDNAQWYDIAQKTGALKDGATDKEAMAFLNNQKNIKNLEEMVKDMRAGLIEFGPMTKTGQKVNDPGYNMGFKAYTYYKYTIENHTQHTFKNVTINIKSTCHSLRFDERTTENSSMRIDELKPGVNEFKYATESGYYFTIENPQAISVSGISDKEYDEAMKTYQFSGNEYKNYLANR